MSTKNNYGGTFCQCHLLGVQGLIFYGYLFDRLAVKLGYFLFFSPTCLSGPAVVTQGAPFHSVGGYCVSLPTIRSPVVTGPALIITTIIKIPHGTTYGVILLCAFKRHIV